MTQSSIPSTMIPDSSLIVGGDCSSQGAICTFRVKEQFRNNGVGKALFGKCLEVLDTNKPLVTIPEEKLNCFFSIIKYYGLNLEQIPPNYYRDNSCEYVFNGLLDLNKPIKNPPINLAMRKPRVLNPSGINLFTYLDGKLSRLS